MQTHIDLKDCQPKDESQNDKITEERTKDILRYLTTHSLKALSEDKDCDILVFPHSFKETQEDLSNSYILSYIENKEGSPEYIGTNNLVGFIGNNGVEISIHSRFSESEGTSVKDYFLYCMLEKVAAINILNLPTSSSNEDMVFDFLLFFFPKMLKEALSQGLYKKYVYNEYNDANLRGAIDLNRHIRHNIPANGRIAYRTREFSYDNPMTQLIRHTIEFIRHKPMGLYVLHNDTETEASVQQIIQATPTYQPQQRQTVINNNLRPAVHPYYTKYTALQKLCLRILRHEKLSYGQANEKIHGILIDAAWLWEEYVAKILNEIGGNHYTRQNSKFKLFKGEESEFQKIIPDYLFPGESNGKNIWVADAKYIPLDNEDRMSAERAAPVYYKTIMYMYRFNTDVGFLLHPSKNNCEDGVSCKTYTIQGGRDGKLHKVGLCVPHGSKTYNEFKEAIENGARSFNSKIMGLGNNG